MVAKPPPVISGTISIGHYHGVKNYKHRKFGPGQAAWLAFREWMKEVIGRQAEVGELTDQEATALIGAMKSLPDAADPNQTTLF